MSGPSRVLFSLHGDHVLIEDREDEDRFLRQLVEDLHEEHVVVEPKREGFVQPVGEEEEEDPEEDPIEDVPAADPVADPVVDPAAEEDVWIEDPLQESDEESYIDWDDVLLHMDDPSDGEDAAPVEHPGLDADGEGFIEVDAEEEGMALIDLEEDLHGGVFAGEGLEAIEEDPIWDFPQPMMEDGPGEPEIIDLDPINGGGQHGGDDIMDDVMH